MDLAAQWDQGLLIDEYLARMTRFQTEMKTRLRDVRITAAECKRLKEFTPKRNIFLMADSHCLDCLMNIPIFMRMVSCAPNIAYRIFPSHEFPELRACFEEQGLSKTPLIYITDEQFQYLNHWAEMPKPAPRMISSWKNDNPDYEILKNMQLSEGDSRKPYFDKLFAMYLNEMWNWYDTGLQSETIKEIMAVLA